MLTFILNGEREGIETANSARVKDSVPHEQVCQAHSTTPTGTSHAKNVCSKGALDKNVHRLAQAMLTTL